MEVEAKTRRQRRGGRWSQQTLRRHNRRKLIIATGNNKSDVLRLASETGGYMLESWCQVRRQMVSVKD